MTTPGAPSQPRLAELRRHLARAQQDQALHPRRGEGAQPRARKEGVREGGAPLRAQPEVADRRPAFAARAERLRLREGGGALRGARLRQARGEERAREAGAAGAAEGNAGERARPGRQRRPARARSGGRQDQGPRLRRPDGVPRALLQSDPRREDHRLHHARQGRVGALRRLHRTSSTCSTTRSGRSTSSGTRGPTRRPTRCGSACRWRTARASSPT